MKNKIVSIHAFWPGVILSGLCSYYGFIHWNDPNFWERGLPGKRMPAWMMALIGLGFMIYCAVGYTLYRNCIIMRLFGIPIWKFNWEQTCAAEYVAAKEKWERPKVKFRIKPRNPGHPYRNLTVSIPKLNADEILVALEECLGTIWMPEV